MKYSEAKKQVKALSSKYDVNMDDGDFNIVYNGTISSIYVSDSCRYSLNIGNRNEFSNMPFSNKLYMILSELSMTSLDKRVEEKKYLVKALGMYLNIETNNNHPSMNTRDDCLEFKTNFTLNEIERLKQREDIALDWNKVKLEEVK